MVPNFFIGDADDTASFAAIFSRICGQGCPQSILQPWVPKCCSFSWIWCQWCCSCAPSMVLPDSHCPLLYVSFDFYSWKNGADIHFSGFYSRSINCSCVHPMDRFLPIVLPAFWRRLCQGFHLIWSPSVQLVKVMLFEPFFQWKNCFKLLLREFNLILTIAAGSWISLLKYNAKQLRDSDFMNRSLTLTQISFLDSWRTVGFRN